MLVSHNNLGKLNDYVPELLSVDVESKYRRPVNCKAIRRVVKFSGATTPRERQSRVAAGGTPTRQRGRRRLAPHSFTPVLCRLSRRANVRTQHAPQMLVYDYDIAEPFGYLP